MAIRKYIGGFIGLFFLSIAVYFIIYFFVPEVSMKFFGIAFSQETVIETAIDSLPVSSETKHELSDSVPALLEALGDNAGELWAFITSEEGLSSIETAAEAARSGAASFEEVLAGELQEAE